MRILEERSQKFSWDLRVSGLGDDDWGEENSVPSSGNSMREGPSVRNHLDAYIFQGLKGDP